MRNKLAAALLAFVALLAAGRADAAILAAGAEDVSFTCETGSSCFFDTNSTVFRASWSRGANLVNSSAGGNSDPPINRFSTPAFSGSATIWVHAQYCQTSANTGACASNATGSAFQMLRLQDDAGNATLIVRGTGTAGQVKISSRTAAGVFTDLVTCSSSFSGSSISQFDLNVVYGGAGSITLYNNAAQVCTYSGDVTNGDGATTITKVTFGGASNAHYGAWSEIIVADSDTRAMNLLTLAPNADGAATGWLGTNICSSIWNATKFNDASYAHTSTNNAIHECAVTDTVPAGVYTVPAAGIAFRGLVGGSGPQHVKTVTRLGSTDYLSTDFSPTNVMSDCCVQIQATNPASAGAWSTSDIPGIQIGLKATP